MHAIKGGWVGQTFALAKCNESGGKKTRIRRSKEERKSMVESFIKKYQKLNDGSFPSLNLTHKECGGSFYTIREIVREVIQENRVLGPAKFTPGEQEMDQYWEQYPVGTISTGPQPAFCISSNESHLAPDQNHGTSEEPVLNSDGLSIGPTKLTQEEQDTDQFLEQYPEGTVPTEPQPTLSISSNEYNSLADHGQGTSEEPVLNSDGLCVGAEHPRLDNGQIINGSHVDVEIRESAKVTCAEFQASEQMEAEKNVEELVASTAKVTDIIKDVIVETFPIRPLTKPTDGLDGRSREVGDLTVILDEREIEKVKLGPSNGSSLLDGVGSPDHSGLVDEGVENSADPLLERESALVDKRAVENLADLPLESSDFTTTKEGVVHGNVEVKLSHNDIVTSDAYEQSEVIAGIKATDAPNGIHTKSSLNRTYTSSSSGESITQVATVIENKADVKCSSSPQKGSNPTLERINLETWEGASKSTAEPEHNPLLAIFKKFIAALVKFWSE